MTYKVAITIVRRIEEREVALVGVGGAQVEILTEDEEGRSTYGVGLLLGAHMDQGKAILHTVDEYTAWANR